MASWPFTSPIEPLRISSKCSSWYEFKFELKPYHARWGNFANALKDSTRAIQLDPEYTKVLLYSLSHTALTLVSTRHIIDVG